MTTITIFSREKGKISGFMLEGHSGFSQSGTDIVCSAITTAAMTAINGLLDVVKIKPLVKIKDGYIKCILPRILADDEKKAADVLLSSMYLTFKNLEMQYSDYIAIQRRCIK